jgi:hypothetical protein
MFGKGNRPVGLCKLLDRGTIKVTSCGNAEFNRVVCQFALVWKWSSNKSERTKSADTSRYMCTEGLRTDLHSVVHHSQPTNRLLA